VRGLLASTGLPGPAATALHLGLVWGGEQVILPALGVSAPVFKYGGKAIATDLLHHTVYATATGLAYSPVWTAFRVADTPNRCRDGSRTALVTCRY